MFKGNNKKATRGRHVHTVEFQRPVLAKNGEPVLTEVDKGWTQHEAVRHVKSVNPQTGEKIYAKQGKGRAIKEHISIPAGTPVIEKRWGYKVWKEQEGTVGNYLGGFGW